MFCARWLRLITDGPWSSIPLQLGGGNIVNISCADGHPAEIMDMSFALQALAARHVVEQAGSLAPGCHPVPAAIDEQVARLKLARAGIGAYFEPGQGGFGSDAEEREALPPIARERAGDWPRERTVVVGDTPRDIACARADGLRVVAVTTGPFTADALAEADHVASGAAELEELLPALA